MSKHNRERRRLRKLGNYVPDVIAVGMKALEERTAMKGRLHRIQVLHDDWCDLIQGRGVCNCNPEVCEPELVPMPGDN